MKKLLHIVFILVLLAVIGVGTYRYMEYKKYEPLRNDYERIATADYTSVFFSTFPVDNYTEDDFAYYREIYPLKSTYCIPDMTTLNEYFTLVTQNGREITSIYLGIRPDIVSAEDLLTLVNTWYGVPFEVHVYSAHRTPDESREFARSARESGFGAIIAAAGKAAHLAGAIAANTTLPVIGIPVKSSTLDGLDALLSTVQMPSGMPVATVAIDGAVNAALLAIQIIGVSAPELAQKLDTVITAIETDGYSFVEALLGVRE